MFDFYDIFDIIVLLNGDLFYYFKITMSIESPSERLERTEAYLKKRLSNYNSIMPVKWWNVATLLAIYWEWMSYLVKENLKGRSDLIEKWKKFLLERNTDAIADLLIGFFEAKRRYGRDMERGEDKRDWFSLCSNYCKKNWWYNDENLLHIFFSSYSWAERRIYKKIETGKVLSDVSKSILQTMALTKSEMIKKEEEKKKKAEEKLKKAEEKKKRAGKKKKKTEEKKKRTEEKEIQKSKEESIDKIPVVRDEWAENHYGWDDENIMNEEWDVVFNPKYEHVPTENSDMSWDDDKKGVDPDYSTTLGWWSDSTDSRVSWSIFQTEEEPWESRKKNGRLKNKQETIIRDENWNLRRTTDGQYLIDFGEESW